MERNIGKLAGIPLYFNGASARPESRPLGNEGGGMQPATVQALNRAVQAMLSSGLALTRIYHLGSDTPSSVPYHSGGWSLDWQGFEMDGERFIMDPASGRNPWPRRPAIWLRVDAALRLQFTYVLSYPYTAHHDHAHVQPGYSPNFEWAPGSMGTPDRDTKEMSSVFFLQQALNWLVTGETTGPLPVTGQLASPLSADPTFAAWSRWHQSRGMPSLTGWSNQAYVALCNHLLNEVPKLRYAGNYLECPARLVADKTLVPVRRFVNALGMPPVGWNAQTGEVLINGSGLKPYLIENGTAWAHVRDITARLRLETQWNASTRTVVVTEPGSIAYAPQPSV